MNQYDALAVYHDTDSQSVSTLSFTVEGETIVKAHEGLLAVVFPGHRGKAQVTVLSSRRLISYIDAQPLITITLTQSRA
jgi:hypothetical protein